MSTFEAIAVPIVLHGGGNNQAKEALIWLVHIQLASSMVDVVQLEAKIISTTTMILTRSSVARPV
jgi:hypothetical protein